MPTISSAVYLYCVVRSVRRPSLARVPAGLPEAGKPVAVEASRSLFVITADVPLDVYGPDALEPRLRDLDWVSQVALAHEAVVEHFARAHDGAVVPAKLFTMFSTVQKAVDDVASRREQINRVIKRIAGCEEWGVRVTRQPGAAVAAEQVSSGAAFLLARKAARDAVAIAKSQAAAAAEQAFAALARHARDATQRERRNEPGTNPPVLEAAFLVTAAARARFKAEAKRQAVACASAGADLALTGPWPAYNFIGDPS